MTISGSIEGLDRQLARALAPVLADIATCGVSVGIDPQPWDEDPSLATAWLIGLQGNAHGIYIERRLGLNSQIAQVAEQAQELLIESLWRQGRSNWPPCPYHPNNHPMQARAYLESADWICPAQDRPVTAIGRLSPPDWATPRRPEPQERAPQAVPLPAATGAIVLPPSTGSIPLPAPKAAVAASAVPVSTSRRARHAAPGQHDAAAAPPAQAQTHTTVDLTIMLPTTSVTGRPLPSRRDLRNRAPEPATPPADPAAPHPPSDFPVNPQPIDELPGQSLPEVEIPTIDLTVTHAPFVSRMRGLRPGAPQAAILLEPEPVVPKADSLTRRQWQEAKRQNGIRG